MGKAGGHGFDRMDLETRSGQESAQEQNSRAHFEDACASSKRLDVASDDGKPERGFVGVDVKEFPVAGVDGPCAHLFDEVSDSEIRAVPHVKSVDSWRARLKGCHSADLESLRARRSSSLLIAPRGFDFLRESTSLHH